MLVDEIKNATSKYQRIRKKIRKGLGNGDRERSLLHFYH